MCNMQGWEESRDNLDRDESMAYFDSESVSKETFMGVVGVNDTFSRTNDSLPVSIDTETVSVSVSKETLMCVEHNLGIRNMPHFIM